MPAELPGTRPTRDDARRFATALAGRKDAPDFVAARGMPLNVVLEQMAEGVIIADPAGCLRWMNPAAARMHGRPVADIPREDWGRGYDLLRVDGTPYPSEELPVARALARGEVVEGEEWVVRRADGSLVRLLGSATPLRDDHARPLGAVVVIRDVTERARLAQSLHAETTAKERFLAHMSHELRTPVSTVLGYTALLCEGDAGALSPTAAQMVGRIARSARHLRELVDDLLDISRLAAGNVAVAQAEVSLPAIVRDTFAAIEPQARAKGLVLELLGSDVPQVRTDARRVRQVLLNLISNAIRCTERGGVTVVLERRPPGAVAVHVIDTGVGIAAEDQERVFDEFVQVGTPRGGTGLGLPISRRLAGLLGGSLTLRSAPGRGSCFTLTLPVANAAADAPPARQAE